jgi:hypothetical protein
MRSRSTTVSAPQRWLSGLAIRASAIFHDLFTARDWRLTMTLMAQRINRLVTEEGGGSADRMRVRVAWTRRSDDCRDYNPVTNRAITRMMPTCMIPCEATAYTYCFMSLPMRPPSGVGFRISK